MYERFDSFMGTVTCTTTKGCYVESDDNPKVRGFYFGGGRIGDKVLCTVKRVNESLSYLLSLDSVISFAPITSSYADAA